MLASAVEKLSGALATVFYVAVAGALVFGVLGWLAVPEDPGPLWLRCASAGAAVVFGCVLAERLVPLRALSRNRWTWRPGGRLPVIDAVLVAQLGVLAALGAVVGVAVAAGWTGAVVGAAVAVIVRIVAGLPAALRAGLPELLAAGRVRFLAESFTGLQDSELVADLLALNWREGRKRSIRRRGPVGDGRTGSVEDSASRPSKPVTPARLAWRRFRRRGHIALAMLLTAALAAGVAPGYGAVGTGAAAVGWALTGPAVYRCADFSRLGVSAPVTRWAAVLVHACVGAAGLAALGARPVAVGVAVLVFAAISVKRGRPRRVDDFGAVDFGLGGVPVELFSYYGRGLLWLFVLFVAL